jgi:hypothetical protein
MTVNLCGMRRPDCRVRVRADEEKPVELIEPDVKQAR